MRFLCLAMAGLIGVPLLAAEPASALSITFALDVEFSGGTDPAGATPWVTVTIDDAADAGGANSVRVTISNANLTGVEFTSEVSLNLDPAKNPLGLAFTSVNTSAVASVGFNTGVNAFQADGDGKFDILFDLPPPPGAFAGKFTAGETISFDLTYTAALAAGDFDFGSASGGGNGTFRAAAHVQAIGPGEGSGWIGAVPEPTLAFLLGAGALAGISRRKQR